MVHSDIAILGAEASGTFAAVRVREDHNLKVTVIEKDDHIGGHTNAYTGLNTGTPVDYGVLSYWDYGPAKKFFARLGVETTTPPQAIITTFYLDTNTGNNLSYYEAPALPDVLE